jgi:hypothetical protein
MSPYIANEDTPDLDAQKLFEEHMHSLEQLEYDRQCEIEAAYDYAPDGWGDEDAEWDALVYSPALDSDGEWMF